MKNSNNPLQIELTKFRKLENELSELRKHYETTSAWRAEQERTADLSDKAALTEIGRLQVLTNLLPSRITGREESLVQAEAELLQTAHKFISEQLSPQLRELLSSVREKAKAALLPHFSDTDELQTAVEKTAGVVEVKNLESGTTINHNPPGGVVSYAQHLINIYQKVESLTAKLV
jgi:hypothetical protein